MQYVRMGHFLFIFSMFLQMILLKHDDLRNTIINFIRFWSLNILKAHANHQRSDFFWNVNPASKRPSLIFP